MNIIRYHTPKRTSRPLSSQFSALADLLGASFTRPVSERSCERFPAVEVSEDDEQFTVRLEAVGLTKESFDVSLQDQVLTISRERNQANKTAEPDSSSSRNQGFSRSLTLSGQVNVAGVRATYQDGILTVSLPKAEAAKPRKVEITSE